MKAKFYFAIIFTQIHIRKYAVFAGYATTYAQLLGLQIFLIFFLVNYSPSKLRPPSADPIPATISFIRLATLFALRQHISPTKTSAQHIAPVMSAFWIARSAPISSLNFRMVSKLRSFKRWR